MSKDSVLTLKEPWPFSVGIPQRFSSHYERYQKLGGLVDVTSDARAYWDNEPVRDVERLMFLSLAFDQIHKESLDGDLAELGVYQGSTATVLARYARRLNRRLYLLDTYEGFHQQDFKGPDAGRRISFSDTSLEAVRARVGEENTTFVKGYFPETADQLPESGRYCLVNIDTDLYAPIMSGLEYFYPRMVPGGFLIVHDYGSLAWDGAEKAVDTFFSDKPECVVQIPDSCGSVVIRRLRQAGQGKSWIAKKQTLSQDVWHSAANGGLFSSLTEGWSAPEPWGTWGVGNSHKIKLIVDAPKRDVAVDIDFDAFVWDEIHGRQFKIFVNGEPHRDLTVSKEKHFTSLTLEPLRSADVSGLLTIEFFPQTVAVPKKVLPSIDESRELGIALHRIRIRSV